jgi:hypothetical protein
MTEACKTCRFFDHHDAHRTQGRCRRYAPRPVVTTQEIPAAPIWVTVRGDDWCGEWQEVAP